MLNNPEQWVDLYADSLYSYALKFIQKPDIAQQLVQETFLAALKNKNTFKATSTAKTWLIGILKHKITDHLRVKYQEIPASQIIPEGGSIEHFFDQEGHLTQPPSDWDFNPQETLANQEFWQTFNDCLSKLPPTTAQAFSLKTIASTDAKEICKVLNITPTNLWVLLCRARIQLRACLEKNWFDV